MFNSLVLLMRNLNELYLFKDIKSWLIELSSLKFFDEIYGFCGMTLRIPSAQSVMNCHKTCFSIPREPES